MTGDDRPEPPDDRPEDSEAPEAPEPPRLSEAPEPPELPEAPRQLRPRPRPPDTPLGLNVRAMAPPVGAITNVTALVGRDLEAPALPHIHS